MYDYTHHRDYKTCNDCGSHLDHGEQCDCHDTKCKCCGKLVQPTDCDKQTCSKGASIKEHRG